MWSMSVKNRSIVGAFHWELAWQSWIELDRQVTLPQLPIA